MIFTLRWILLPVICMSLSFSDRNKNNLLFEYTFSETECENSLFLPTEYVPGTSFGNLVGGLALDCIARSGFRGITQTTGNAFISSNTFSGYHSRIMSTREYSVEMWIKSEEQDFMTTRILSIGTLTDNGSSTDLLWSLQIFEDDILFIPTYLSGGSYSSLLYTRESDGYVHLIFTIKMRQSGTDIKVGPSFLQ